MLNVGALVVIVIAYVAGRAPLARGDGMRQSLRPALVAAGIAAAAFFLFPS